MAEQFALSPQPRVGVNQPAGKLIDMLHASLEFLVEAQGEACRQPGDTFEQPCAFGTDQLGCGGRRGRAPVGHEVGDREVGFVPDSGDDRNRACANRPRHDLFVESPQVLDAAAAAHQQYGIALAEAAGDLERRGDLLRRPLALYLHGKDDHPDGRVTPSQRRQYVPKRRRLARGDDADRARQQRQPSFRFGIEQALLFEFVTQPEEGLEQGAEPGAPHGFDIELEIAARLVQADERLHLDLHAIARRPLQILLALPEHDAAHLGVLVLQNEIGVSRLGHGEIGHLAGDPKQRIATLEQLPDAASEA